MQVSIFYLYVYIYHPHIISSGCHAVRTPILTIQTKHMVPSQPRCWPQLQLQGDPKPDALPEPFCFTVCRRDHDDRAFYATTFCLSYPQPSNASPPPRITPKLLAGWVTYACNPSTQEAEAGG
jgi:hypothetical protein